MIRRTVHGCGERSIAWGGDLVEAEFLPPHGLGLLFGREGDELGRTHLYEFGYKICNFGHIRVNSSD